MPAVALGGTVFLFATKAIVSNEISKLNGTYIRKEYKDVVEARFKAIEDHFDYLRDQTPREARAARGGD